ncbi:MAG: NUDIX domain-containing protein [bacterium]|nr:NUDIX domain-containing protein [bacterium]
MVHRLPSQEFKEIYSRVPRLCVEVMVKKDGGIVLSLRDLPSWKGQWHIPGGTVFYRETLPEAVKRVAQDELGVKVEIEKFLGHNYFPSEEKERGYGWSISAVFLTRYKSGSLRGSNQGKEVRTFQEFPENLIKEQKEFLIAHSSEIFYK